jgi:hypothetical protein
VIDECPNDLPNQKVAIDDGNLYRHYILLAIHLKSANPVVAAESFL